MDFIILILLKVVNIYRYILIIHIILSWFPQIRESGFGRFIGAISEPYLEPFRRIVPNFGMFDFSPIVALITLQFASYGLVGLANFF